MTILITHFVDRTSDALALDEKMHAPSLDITRLAPETPSYRRIPLTEPNAPKLSAYVEDLTAIEESRWLTNYGPTNSRLEKTILENVFEGVGSCLTVCNATIGLMIALKQAAETRPSSHGRFVIMPSFTFAAAAHAVLWAGLTPLLVDVDPNEWSACQREEELLLRKYGRQIAAIMPYATFGSCIDLTHYDRLARQYGVPVVVDAAASLGSIDECGRAFGRGSMHTIVFSMHATKAFGVGECGLIYSADPDKIAVLRCMGNFGFDGARSAVVAGLNSKISEVVALTALIKLSDYKAQVLHRSELAQLYISELPSWKTQQTRGSLVAYQFMPMLMPDAIRPVRELFCQRLAEAGIGVGRYFSPHILEQSYFKKRCVAGRLDVTHVLSMGLMSFPLSDFLTVDDVIHICSVVRTIEQQLSHASIDNNVARGTACSQIALTP